MKGNISKKRVDNGVAASIKEILEDTRRLANSVNEAAAKFPYVGENGNWYVWDFDNEVFKDSGITAEGITEEEEEEIIRSLNSESKAYIDGILGNAVSDDNLTDIVTKFVQNNAEMLKGKDGKDGRDGKDGYTPVRGYDYWNEEDKAEIINESKEILKDFAVDDAMSDTSTNAVQNKIVKAYVDKALENVNSIIYGENTPPEFTPEAVAEGTLYIDTLKNIIYRCLGSNYIEREGTYYVVWESVLVASAHTPHIKYCTLLDNGYASLDLYYDEAKEIITNREDILLVVDFLSDEGNEEVAEVAKVIAYRIKEDVIYLHTIIRGVGYELRCTPDSEGVWTTSITVAQLGDIEYALERIIELQNSLIGGDGV